MAKRSFHRQTSIEEPWRRLWLVNIAELARLRHHSVSQGANTDEQKITLSRPMHLVFTEMLLAFSCIYMAFAYAVFYM